MRGLRGICFFFFQAEDGIRDGRVIGVQTCALPICSSRFEESREFAEDIQDSLAHRVQRSARNVKNRGVRRAPFVVLIGANMPSVLAEISFLSNRSEERRVGKECKSRWVQCVSRKE